MLTKLFCDQNFTVKMKEFYNFLIISCVIIPKQSKSQSKVSLMNIEKCFLFTSHILKEKLRVIFLTLNVIYLTVALNFWRKAYLLNLEGIKIFSIIFFLARPGIII